MDEDYGTELPELLGPGSDERAISQLIRASELAEYIVQERTLQYLGYQMLLRFPNNYGASLVSGPYSYGGPAGLYEIAVLIWAGEETTTCYDTEITTDVLGWLSEEEVVATLREIQALK